MRKYLFLITLSVISYGLIVTTTSCEKNDPEVVVGDKGEKGDKGEQGERGVSGPKGDKGNPGNANVKKFSFDVEASLWKSAHFGASNVHNYYDVSPDLTGGISISNSNYVTLVFAKPANIYREYKQLPYRFNVIDNYAILLEFAPTRSELLMSKTTNGINTLAVPLAERPTHITYTVFMIEIGAVNALKGKIDFNKYDEVSSYFNLN